MNFKDSLFDREQNTQTVKNSSSLVPRTVHYLSGLRYGQSEHVLKDPNVSVFQLFASKDPAKFKIVDLTQDSIA